MHFVPACSSRLDQVECFFAVITDKAIRRGSFKSVKAPTNNMDMFVSRYNESCKPFSWTATADPILEKLSRLCLRIDGTGH
ncbi:putative transposase [Variovorax sp. NFACC28]|jgi:putative transposase|nr:putative transposase [Variovorax paradoxus]SEF35312.1 putative transposase [Variovorax sp. NFACC28]SEG99268.1 putative transposase [Variovorax sp. NFACC29]SFE20327.1 putative transposase [Variovorax sp. NFACC26]SFH25742.1 putative transposase [Variovorax sp. NFACC27]